MNKHLEYKGYIGIVEMDVEEGFFHGTVEGIKDVIDFAGESFPELKQAFEDSVDDYLEFCEETGRIPDKNYSGSIPLRISPDLHRNVARSANVEGISMNKWIERSIASSLSQRKESFGGMVATRVTLSGHSGREGYDQ